jgi:PIN domain nuclease of toxin-antitoxin system
VLLDTHAFLWYVLDDPQLSPIARSAIDSGGADDSAVLVSPASYWEIAIKISLGKYTLKVPYETFWRTGIGESGFEVLPIEVRHTAKLVDLPFHHRDPFDRLLIAQAMVEGISVVSSDSAMDRYGVKRIW